MKNLVVAVIIAIAAMASFSQVQAQSVYPAGQVVGPLVAGDIIDIGEIDNEINEERKIYVRVEDGNNTNAKGKIHFKIMTENGKNAGSYNVKAGEDFMIDLPENGTYYIDVIKTVGNVSIGANPY